MPGPFYFAWVDPSTEFDEDVHNVEDEQIVSFNVSQTEGEFAILSIDIKNPRIGLLNIGRKRWAWLSWYNGTAIAPLFMGVLVGVPTSINKEVVTLEFIARPPDFAQQKADLAEYMRELPFYDPVFIAENRVADPDVVLEGRTEMWHIDRITHEVSTSDLLVGEEGVLSFSEDEVPYDTVEITLDQPPVRRVRVEAKVPWVQSVSGEGLQVARNWRVQTLAGKGVVDGWPGPGDDMGGGFHVTTSSARSRWDNLTSQDMATRNKNGEAPFAVKVKSSESTTVSNGQSSISTSYFGILADDVYVNLSAGYKADRNRTDTVVFELVADTQDLVTSPGDDELLELIISGNDVGARTGLSDEIPIGSVLRRSYFTQERGMKSLQYLIQLARANIIVRSRAVKTSWECLFARAVEVSLRHNALIHDRRLPGGEALGKVVGYSFSSIGGKLSGSVTIASAIGRGGQWLGDDGEPDYVDEDYCDPEYQVYIGSRVILGATDVGFVPLVQDNEADDGLVFPLRGFPGISGLHNETIATKALAQGMSEFQGSTQADDCGNTTNISSSMTFDTGPYNEWLGGIETKVKFSFKPVTGGPFEAIYVLDVTDLKIPKQIDLEAASS